MVFLVGTVVFIRIKNSDNSVSQDLLRNTNGKTAALVAADACNSLPCARRAAVFADCYAAEIYLFQTASAGSAVCAVGDLPCDIDALHEQEKRPSVVNGAKTAPDAADMADLRHRAACRARDDFVRRVSLGRTALSVYLAARLI